MISAGFMRLLQRSMLPLLLALLQMPVLAQRVEPEFFGLNLSRPSAGEPWPDIPVGSWRLWDAQVSWPHLEPVAGRWSWTLLDRYVSEAERQRVPLLLVLGQSPSWASARPSERSAYKPGMAAEPRDMEAWVNYVQTVAQRYRGRVKSYQVWNEPSDAGHYSGSVSKLVELTCAAHRVLKRIDPTVLVVGAGSAGPGKHIQYLADFLAAGGGRCIDVVDHHFYVPRHTPEAMVPLIRQVKAVMKQAGVGHLPLWSTEVGWWVANDDNSPDHAMVANGGWRKVEVGDELLSFLVRAHVLARSEGVERLYWYAWRNQYGWGLSETRTGRAKAGVNRWGDWIAQLLGSEVRECSYAGVEVSCAWIDKDRKSNRIVWTEADRTAREGVSLKRWDRAAMPRILPP